MKQKQGNIITAVSGLILLGFLFFQPRTSAYLNLILNWAIVLSAVALLVAVARLLTTHMRHVAVGRRGFLYSIVLIVSFSATFIAGMFMGEADPDYLRWIKAFQIPLESAMLGLLALVMMSAAIKIFRERGWSILTISFGISAVIFLILNIGVLPVEQYSGLEAIIATVQRLPVIGSRGLLIGVGLGALITGLRVLFGQVVENESNA